MTEAPSNEAEDRAAELRRRAEVLFVQNAHRPPESPEEIQRLLHELGVHQIELEMQNDELRRAQLELEASRSRWIELYESAPVGYLTVGPAGEIRQLNLCAANMLGRARGELLKQPFTKFIFSEDQDTFYLLSQKLLLADDQPSCELRLAAADGKPVWTQLATTAAHDPDGSRELRIALIDITTRKLFEASVQSQKVAEAASRAKSLFLANMSHELRTPLNAIIGFADLLKRSELTPKQVDRLDKIISAGKHLVEVIDSVLSLSRIDAGKLEPVDAAVDLPRIIAAVVTMLSEQAATKGLHLAAEPVPATAQLRGDPTLLQQTLLNLVMNAVKFTPAGKVVVRACIESETADHALVRFEVEDTGIGIDPEVLPRLFSDFEQADNSSIRTYGGIGLGLAIARRIARLMGGDAGVTSELGKGSAFWFTACLRKSASRPDQPLAGPSDAAEAGLLARFAGTSVLLAEDEPLNREVIVSLLADLELEVAVDGVEAVRLAAAHRYDLVILGVQLPRMDGLEAARRIREIAGYASVPMIALTASGFDDDRSRSMQAGMDAFLTKPVDSRTLFKTVFNLLSRQR
ncbi:MAG: ATP-binding protein [Burkholderiaceae bacterium]